MDEFSDYLLYECNRSRLTAEAYGRDCRQFVEWLTCCDMDAFDPRGVDAADVRGWLAGLARQGMTARTLRRKLESVRAYFRWMRKRGLVDSDPSRNVALPKVPKPLPDTVRPADVEGALESLTAVGRDNPDDLRPVLDRLVVETLYVLGIRRAELVELNDGDINLETGEARITGKRDKQRIVPVPEGLCARIAEWKSLRDKAGEGDGTALFAIGGRRVTAAMVYGTVKRALAMSEARRKSPHALRHTFATAMLDGGADLNSVKEFLGHESLETTQIYTHVSFAEMRRAYSAAHPRGKGG